MANIDITGGITYQFARIQGNTIILDSDDHSHAVKTFANKIHITGSNVPTVALQVDLNTSGYIHLQRPATSTSTNPILNLQNNTNSGYCYMKFQGDDIWSMGVYNDTTADDRHFKIVNSSLLGSTNDGATVGFSVAPRRSSSPNAMPVFMPHLNSGTGTNYLKYNTTGGELTYQTSTQKNKKNITSPPSKIYDTILALQPRYFEMKDPNDNKQYLSFIAEETAAVSPKFSTYAEDFDYDDKGINRNKELLSDKLVPMDIDERAIIAALVGKIQDLENRIKTLENN